MPPFNVNPKALIYIERRLRMSLHPLGFAALCGAALTVVSVSILITQQHGADVPFKRGPTLMSAAFLLILFSGFGWFIRRMAISGSWLNYERIEGAYRAGLKREAWNALMTRYRIHAEVVQSTRCRSFLRDICRYVTSMDLLKGDQQELADRLLAAVAAADVRLTGSTEKASTVKWGKRIIVAGLIVIVVRAIAELLSLWHL